MKTSQGFTAVELLITLFVAAAFLVAGYQLFNVVIRDGGQTRAESRASNVAYDYLRRYTASTTVPCTASTPLNAAPINITGLTDATVTVAITCLPDATTILSKIEVTLKYNTPSQTVKYATYSNSGGGTDSEEITDGLINWWKLNGDANTAVGSANGTVNGSAAPTIGQNGQANTGYNLPGSGAYIRFPLTNFPDTMNTITITLWTKQSAAGTSPVMWANPYDSSNVISLFTPQSSNGLFYFYFGPNSSLGYITTSSTLYSYLNTWNFWTLVSSPATGMKMYLNGDLISSSANTNTFTKSTRTLDMGYYAAGSSYWIGQVDDLRIYNRALTQGEAQTLYTRGAQ